jgi:hypothetical protein
MVMEFKRKATTGKSKVTVLDDPSSWGVYVWQKSDGKWFTDGSGSILNIPSNKGDIGQITKLSDAAKYHGEGDGKAVFFGGLDRISEEQHSEQVDRMKHGLIPNMNDLGAVIAAKKTLTEHGEA